MSNDALLANARASLEAERDELLARLEELGVVESNNTSLSYDTNFADNSQVSAERGEVAALAVSLKETLEEVLLALSKIETGSFGVCERCGNAISNERLEAMPTSRLCMECASHAR